MSCLMLRASMKAGPCWVAPGGSQIDIAPHPWCGAKYTPSKWLPLFCVCETYRSQHFFDMFCTHSLSRVNWLLKKSSEPIQKPTILDSNVRVRRDPSWRVTQDPHIRVHLTLLTIHIPSGRSARTLIWESLDPFDRVTESQTYPVQLTPYDPIDFHFSWPRLTLK